VKLSPQMAAITARMAPGVIVRDGLLGDDPRPLPEILDADNARVRAMGLDHAAIARRMRQITEQGRRGLGNGVAIGQGLEARVEEFPGPMACPFGGCGVMRKAVTFLRDPTTGAELRWSALGEHMIGEHGFYQGQGSPWRQDPETLARAIGLLSPPLAGT